MLAPDWLRDDRLIYGLPVIGRRVLRDVNYDPVADRTQKRCRVTAVKNTERLFPEGGRGRERMGG